MKYISHFSYFVIGIILVQIYSLHKKISSFVDFFLWIDEIMFQAFQISPKFIILSSSLVYTTCQNFEMQKIILCENNSRDSNVLMPRFIIFKIWVCGTKGCNDYMFSVFTFFPWLLIMIWFYNFFIKLSFLLNNQFKVCTFHVSFHRNYVVHFVEFNETHGQNNRSLHYNIDSCLLWSTNNVS